ncbi:hypothetical protein [Effusibacillus pohliae]|uniref:hypothetical protein n=1 Tax=Effusibacillus pohliae TaxID=232270 RepID=UPI00036B4369|nr:hypothetical protein [Effusibacillus pohliae]
MKKYWFRFSVLLVLPFLIIGAVMFGVAILESYEEKGEFLVPERPPAHELARVSYQFVDPATKQPLHDVSVHVEIEKTKALNPWLYVGYLREDHQGIGLVQVMDLHLYNGKLELDTNFWDAGSYVIALHAAAPGLQQPIDAKIPVEVRVPLGQLIRTFALFVAIFVAAVASGYVGGSLENPFRKKQATAAVLRRSSTVSLLALAVAGSLLAHPKFAWAHGHGTPSSPPQTVSLANQQIRAELKVNPAEPVQKGAPAHFAIELRDAKTGQPMHGLDASVSLYHVDDNLTMFATRTQIPDGLLEFDYAFPDTAEYKVVLHAAPDSPQSSLRAPFDGEFTFEVPPVDPSPVAQLRAGMLMLATVIAGLALGALAGRRSRMAAV